MVGTQAVLDELKLQLVKKKQKKLISTAAYVVIKRIIAFKTEELMCYSSYKSFCFFRCEAAEEGQTGADEEH